MNNNDHRWYKGPRTIGNNEVMRPTHISTRRVDVGDMVEAVREGTFVYAPDVRPTLYPGDSITGGPDGTQLVTRRPTR